jgi:hypothetical protein
MVAALRFQTAPGGSLMGRFGFEALGCSSVPFLCRRRELHHVLEFLRLVEFQRQRRDRGSARISRVDRSRLVSKMVHRLALRMPAARARCAQA